MIKQWYHKGLGIYYVYLPEKEGYVLTSDGVMIKFDNLMSLSMDKYIELKTTKNGFDYNKTRVQEKLVPKSSRSLVLTDKAKEVLEPKKEVKSNGSKRGRPRKNQSTFDKIENFNLFDWIYPKLMLILAVFCSVLSIYFTGVYLQRLQPKVIAFVISFSMLIYGLIGSQMSRRAFKNNKKLQGFLYAMTSVGVIIFSMFSSLDVNYSKYIANHKEEMIEKNVESNDTVIYNRLLEDKKSYEEKIRILMQQNTPDMGNVWNETLGKMVWTSLGTTSLSKDAKQKINVYEEKIAKINDDLLTLEMKGVSVENVKEDKINSLTDLIGRFILNGNIIQMLILLVPSIFIDLINILSITIYCDRYEQKK